MTEPETSEARTGRLRLGEVLVSAGVITKEQVTMALDAQRLDARHQRLGSTLIELEMCTEQNIATALSEQLGVPLVDLDDRPPPRTGLTDLVPRHLADHHALVPLAYDEEEGLLTVAMADPTNVVALDDLRTLPGVRTVTMVVARASSVTRLQSRAYERAATEKALDRAGSMGADQGEVLDHLDVQSEEPVIRVLNSLLADAVRSRASDVHIEPERAGMRVRYRIDGILREVQRIPRALAPAVTSRIKIMAQLDISERRRPQNGRSGVVVDGFEVDLRVSTMPSLYGETTVLRLLRKGAERLSIDDLGFSPEQRRAYELAISRSQGLIVMTGPTGSGKTTTLYAGLAELAGVERNIVTLEDPVEYQLDGVNQTQVQPKIEMTFAVGLRSMLRQDPDVIMVGEVRDGETAQLAVDASFTGHLVFTTLHTNDAASTVARLAELGVERFLLGTTLSLVVAQRLARRVCSSCAVAYRPDTTTLELVGLTLADLAEAPLRRGTGCPECEQTGYRGRVGLYEFLPLSRRLRQLISDGGNELQIGALARAEGMRSLREDGMQKALLGHVTLEEVLRVTPEDQFLSEPSQSSEEDHDRLTRTAIKVGAIAPARVLAVGDTQLLEEVKRALPEGWSVSLADDTEDALQQIRSADPHVVVLQSSVQGVPAAQLLMRLRQDSHDLRPVLLRTDGPMAEAELNMLLAAGVSDHVAAGAPVAQLRARLEALAPTR